MKHLHSSYILLFFVLFPLGSLQAQCTDSLYTIGCGSTPTVHTIYVNNGFFSPDSLPNVFVGDSIRFVLSDAPHAFYCTSTPGPNWAAYLYNPGDVYAVEVTNPGYYNVQDTLQYFNTQIFVDWGTGLGQIDSVAINNILVNQDGSCSNTVHRVNKTGIADTVLLGAALNIGIGTFGSAAEQDVAVWINWNDDLDFMDAGEFLYSATTTGESHTQTNAGNANALGNHLMRIRCKPALGGFGASDACTRFERGETEDYTLVVLDSCRAGYITANFTQVCNGGKVDLVLNNPTGGTIYQWEAGPVGGPYTPIAGATGLSYTFGPLSADTAVRCAVMGGSCNITGTQYTSPITLNVAYSDTSYWQGTIDSTWNEPMNWSPNCIPGCATTVIIPDGQPRYPYVTISDARAGVLYLHANAWLYVQNGGTLTVCDSLVNLGDPSHYQNLGETSFEGDTVVVDGNTPAEDVSLEDTTVVILQGDWVINGTISLGKGKINTNGNELILTSLNPFTGTPTDTTFIEGTVRQVVNPTDVFFFPMGYTTPANEGVGALGVIDFNGLATGFTHLRVSFVPWASQPVVSITENGATYNCTVTTGGGQWDVEPTDASGNKVCTGNYTTNYDLTIYPTGTDPGCAAYWTIMSYDDCAPSPAWAMEGKPSQLNDNFDDLKVNGAKRDSLQGFSGKALVGTMSLFPIQLKSLKAEPNVNHIQLSWTTTEEQNNAGFGIMRKEGGADEAQIDFVPGHIHSQETRNYELTDHRVVPGVAYSYRLKQYDLNGHFTYSSYVTAMIDDAGNSYSLSAPYPMPGGATLHWDAYSVAEGTLHMELRNMQGQIVHTTEQPLAAGSQQVSLDVTHLPAGNYTVAFMINGQTFMQRILQLSR